MKLITSKKFLLGLMMAGSLELITGCAIMDEDTCRTTNWYQQGVTDGSKGTGSAILAEYVDACSDYVYVDRNAYAQGRQEGAVSFCTPERGFSSGKSGWTVTDVCDKLPQREAFMVTYTKGRSIYEAHQTIANIDEMLEQISNLGAWNVHSIGLTQDYNYLLSLRSQIVGYIDMAEQAGANGNYQVWDFSNVIEANMPDRWAVQGLANKAKAIDDVTRELDRIRSNSCYSSNSKSCTNKSVCLLNAENRLTHKLRDYLRGTAPVSYSVERVNCR